MQLSSRNTMKVTVTGEHRDGTGKLIAKTYSVQPPPPLKGLGAKSLLNYYRGVIFCELLTSYHRRRVAYAEKNRRKEILEKYRTGEPSPDTIMQAIKESTLLIIRR